MPTNNELSMKEVVHNQMTTVTPFSKVVALLLFILIPIIAFMVGSRYQQGVDSETLNNEPPVVYDEAQVVPDSLFDSEGDEMGSAESDLGEDETMNLLLNVRNNMMSKDIQWEEPQADTASIKMQTMEGYSVVGTLSQSISANQAITTSELQQNKWIEDKYMSETGANGTVTGYTYEDSTGVYTLQATIKGKQISLFLSEPIGIK